MYAFKCKDEIEAKIKLKGISKSQPKNIIFQEHYNSVYGKKVIRECENCILGPNYSWYENAESKWNDIIYFRW